MSIITILISIKNKMENGKRNFYGIFIWWGLIGLLLLFVLIDFKIFYLFSFNIFRNDLWLLDPNTDLLIQMLPEEFLYSYL